MIESNSPLVSQDNIGIAVTDESPADTRLQQKRIRVRIPKEHHREPVISNLISQQGLKVNIAAALLGSNANEDGWFDLNLEGTQQQIDSALIYLSDLDVQTWQDSDTEADGW